MNAAKNWLKLFCVTIFLAASLQGFAADHITIGLQSNEGNLDLAILQKTLAERLGLPVQVSVSKDYAGLVDNFKNKKVDFAFMSGINFVEAEREAAAKVLLKKVYRDKDEFYYAALLVRADSPFKKVAQLKGKKMGFVDPKSTSGYLFGRALLRHAGLDAGVNVPAGPQVLAHQFFGTHEASVQALLDKKVDVVAVWSDGPGKNTGAWTIGPFSGHAKSFRVLATSEPIPNDAFVVRQEFYSEKPLVVLKVMEAMIALADDPRRPLKKSLDVEGMATATSRHYDSVRALVTTLKP